MEYTDLQKTLVDSADDSYKRFKGKIIPGVNCMGVKIPVLRRIARENSAKDVDPRLISSLWASNVHEETLILGFILGFREYNSFEESFKDISAYAAKIDNWEACDLFVCSIKNVVKNNHDAFYSAAKEMARGENAWEARFGLVLLLWYYNSSARVDEILAVSGSVASTDYYVRIANAWLLSVLFCVDKGKVTAFISQSRLDAWTIHKAIQKIRESNKVSDADKEMVLGLKKRV